MLALLELTADDDDVLLLAVVVVVVVADEPDELDDVLVVWNELIELPRLEPDAELI